MKKRFLKNAVLILLTVQAALVTAGENKKDFFKSINISLKNNNKIECETPEKSYSQFTFGGSSLFTGGYLSFSAKTKNLKKDTADFFYDPAFFLRLNLKDFSFLPLQLSGGFMNISGSYSKLASPELSSSSDFTRTFFSKAEGINVSAASSGSSKKEMTFSSHLIIFSKPFMDLSAAFYIQKNGKEAFSIETEIPFYSSEIFFSLTQCRFPYEHSDSSWFSSTPYLPKNFYDSVSLQLSLNSKAVAFSKRKNLSSKNFFPGKWNFRSIANFYQCTEDFSAKPVDATFLFEGTYALSSISISASYFCSSSTCIITPSEKQIKTLKQASFSPALTFFTRNNLRKTKIGFNFMWEEKLNQKNEFIYSDFHFFTGAESRNKTSSIRLSSGFKDLTNPTFILKSDWSYFLRPFFKTDFSLKIKDFSPDLSPFTAIENQSEIEEAFSENQEASVQKASSNSEGTIFTSKADISLSLIPDSKKHLTIKATASFSDKLLHSEKESSDSSKKNDFTLESLKLSANWKYSFKKPSKINLLVSASIRCCF